MPSVQNKEMLQEITTSFQQSAGVYIIDYRGLTVREAQDLRRKLREAGATMKVYKNNLVKLALDENKLPNMDSLLVGTCAYVFYESDPVGAAKAIKTTSKALEKLEVKGGIADGAEISAAEIIAIADLPSREELLAKVVGSLSQPLRGVVGVLSGPQRNLVTVLSSLADQKQKEAA